LKVAITGSNGFVGTALYKLLKEKNYQPWQCKVANNRLPPSNFHKEEDLEEESVLVHLAQPRDVSKPYDESAVKLCKELSKRPWRHIVYASSAVIYGGQQFYPRHPDEKIVAQNGYSKMKLECEKIFEDRGATSLRLSNIYGKGMSQDSVISDILRQIPQSGPISLKNLNAIRDFVWIDDVAESILCACINKADAILNVGSGVVTSISELANLAVKISNRKNQSVISKNSFQVKSCLKLCLKKTQSIINWSPKTDLESGMRILLSEII
jgi:nucleoside-diphosphate-sugar epimerase